MFINNTITESNNTMSGDLKNRYELHRLMQ